MFKSLAFAGALLASALCLSACGSDPTTGNPTILGVSFTTGSATLNAKMVSLGQKIDAGILTAQTIEQTDLPGLCALGAKVQPLATSSAALASPAQQSKIAPVLAALNAALASPSCAPGALTGAATDGITIAQSIQQITAAAKTSATAAAKS